MSTPDHPNIHPATLGLLRWFDSGHLPKHLAEVSDKFGELAYWVADRASGAEVTTAVRKILEAKDCAVRAAVAKNEQQNQANG